MVGAGWERQGCRGRREEDNAVRTSAGGLILAEEIDEKGSED
jgi:hypothetical protein